MSDRGQTAMSMRCPVCFAQGIDVVLFRDSDEFYCIKCSFTGKADEIHERYADFRKKFRFIGKRLPASYHELSGE